jgi:hypothetical protein
VFLNGRKTLAHRLRVATPAIHDRKDKQPESNRF